MIYPCKNCQKRIRCKKDNSCEKRKAYLQFRKRSIERNRIWARESTNVCYPGRASDLKMN